MAERSDELGSTHLRAAGYLTALGLVMKLWRALGKGPPVHLRRAVFPGMWAMKRFIAASARAFFMGRLVACTCFVVATSTLHSVRPETGGAPQFLQPRLQLLGQKAETNPS